MATILQIRSEIATNLFDEGLKWYTEDDIDISIQEAYNKLVALLCPIEKTTLVPQQSHPYYNFGSSIGDFLYVSAIYNPFTNLWLEGMSWKLMKNTYQTYLAIGQPKFVNIMDFNRQLIWPFMAEASGVLLLVYKAKAPAAAPGHTPILPHSVGPQLLQYFATADALEQAREFSKAAKWWDRLFKPSGKAKKSIYQQAELEIKDLARADREIVLEPYRWIFHGGQWGGINNDVWISNETPAGTQDGINTGFTLSRNPNPASSLLLIKNGQTLFEGIGYDLNGSNITYHLGYTPRSDDEVRAWYQIS